MPKGLSSTTNSQHRSTDVHANAENEQNVACYSGASANSTNGLHSDVVNLVNTLNDDALQGHCHVCGKNIQHMSLQFQTQHINRCLDQSEKAEPPAAVSNVTTRPLVLDCPICGQSLKTENSRRSHLKKCANKFNVPLPELMDAIKKQEEERRQIMQSDMIPDHVPVSRRGRSRSTVTTVAGRKRLHKDRLEEPKSKLDEDTHLAIALSIHETESADQLRESEKPSGDGGNEQLSNNAGLKPDLFTILMSSEMSKSRDQPAGKKSKKKLQSREPLPLLATDQNEWKRKIELKVSNMIIPSSSTDNTCGSQNRFSSRCSTDKMLQFPESRLRNKYIVNNESQVQPETRLWSETSTASDSKKSYYVKDLEPFISICSLTGQSAAAKRKCPVASVNSSSSTTTNVADVTLYTSTQTAVDLAELAAEIGDQTVFLDDETFRSPESEKRDVAMVVTDAASQGSSQSHKDEVASEAVSDLLKDLRCLIDVPNHSDLMLCCQTGDAIHSHRLIIGVRCPKLIEMADSCNKVDLTDFSRKSVLSLVHFLYTGDTNISTTVVSELKRLAIRLQMPKLSCICDSIIVRDSSVRLGNSSPRISDAVATKSFSTCSLQEDTEDERTAEERDWNEVHDFFVTQLKRAADNVARDRSEGETAGIGAAGDDNDDNDNDTISSDTDRESDTGDTKKACYGEDDDVYLSQALLHKLEESFSASGGTAAVGSSSAHGNDDDDADKTGRNSCRNKVTENESTVRSPLNDCSTAYDSDATRDNSPMCSRRSETDVMELNEPDDPCDGRYDQIDVDVEQKHFVEGETAQAMCSTLPETGQSSYSAVSPLSMFDEDSISGGNDDCNGPLLVSIPTSVLSSSIYKTPESRNVNPEQNNQFSPAGRCLSPDDLFKSPSCDEKNSSFTLGDQLTRGSSVRASGSNRICKPPTEVTATNKAAAVADDDKPLVDLPVTSSRSSNKCSAVENSRSRCIGNADIECLPNSGSSSVVDVAAPSSSNWQWLDDVEPDSDVDLGSRPSTHAAGAVSVIKRCSKASFDYCETNTETVGVSQCPPEINVVVIDDDDDDDVVEPSQSLRDKSGLNNSVNVDQTEVSDSETAAAENRLSIPAEQSFTGEEVVTDVWEGFDEGYAAGYYCADMNTSTSSGRLVTTPRDRRSTGSIAFSASQQCIGSSSPTFPATLASLVKLRQLNTSSSISGRAKMSYSQPNSSSAAETSTMTPKTPVIVEHVRDDCDLPTVLSSPELAAYSPPTDMDTDVSALMDQLAANNAFGTSDDSFETVQDRECSTAAVKSRRTSKSNVKTAITPMPDYKQMVTPALKLQCKKFGVRALPKQKMVKVLEDIYFGTHPAVERPVEEKKKKRPTKRTAPTSTDSSLETRTRQLPGPTKTSKLKRSDKSADVESSQPAESVDVSSKPVHKSLSLSDGSSDGSSSTDSTDDDSDHENVPEESVMYSPEKQKNKQVSVRGLDEASKKKLLREYIKSKTELYQKILQYEPLELDEFVSELKDNGIKLPAKDVVNFLDELNILFTTRKSQTGWASRRAGNKKRTQKTRSPKNKATTSVSGDE